MKSQRIDQEQNKLIEIGLKTGMDEKIKKKKKCKYEQYKMNLYYIKCSMVTNKIEKLIT